MPNRRTRVFTFAAAGIVAFALAACGGGGGGSVSPVVTPTPTPTATSIGNVPGACAAPAVAAPANCVYTFQSNQAGLAVFVNSTQIGVTGANPITTSPPFSVTPQTVTFGTGASAYTVTIDQTGNASHTIYYNTLVDTGSTASMQGAASTARQALSLMTETRRGVRSFSRTPAVATSGVYVRYDASKLTASRSIDRIESDAGSAGGFDVLSSVAAIRGRVVRVPSGNDVRTITTRLQQESAVQGVYPLHYRVPLAATPVTPTDPYFKGTGITKEALTCGQATSNDCQWDMRQMHADYAWFYGPPGALAKIAVLDTGIDVTNPDITANLVFSATTAGTQGKVVQTQGSGQNDPSFAAAQDTNGHGSNVAGIADADTNDAVGFAGVGYGAKLYVYRIFPTATSSSDEQSADTGDEATAIADAVTRGVDVINLSIGAAQYDPASGTGFDQAEHDAVEAAIGAGVSVVAAAGNEGATTLDFPAAYDGVISVGASSLADGQTNGSGKSGGTLAAPIEYVASYSNAGPGLAVVAPGGDPNGGSDGDYLHWVFNDSTNTAALAGDKCSAATSPDVCKSLFAGTSQATPHVAGVVALVQSALRSASKPPLTAAQMLSLIEGTADNINDAKQGHGRVNVLRAIEAALGLAPSLVVPASSTAQFVAFAYTNSGAVNAIPAIADVFYTHGVPIGPTGAFRIADVNTSTGVFKFGVWLDANGDGKVDAGDQFGFVSGTCSGSGVGGGCHPGTITVSVVPAGNFTLP